METELERVVSSEVNVVRLARSLRMLPGAVLRDNVLRRACIVPWILLCYVIISALAQRGLRRALHREPI